MNDTDLRLELWRANNPGASAMYGALHGFVGGAVAWAGIAAAAWSIVR